VAASARLESEDLEGKDFIDFVHPDDVERTIAANVAEWTNHRQRARDSRADSVVVTERTVGLNDVAATR